MWAQGEGAQAAQHDAKPSSVSVSTAAQHTMTFTTVSDCQGNDAAMLLFNDGDITTIPFSCRIGRQEGSTYGTDWAQTDRQEDVV